MKARPAIHARDHRRGGEDPLDTLPREYPVTVSNVSNTTTPTTFLEFDVPANDIKLGDIVYVQWTAIVLNGSGGTVQPTLTMLWGDSLGIYELDDFATGIAPWDSHFEISPPDTPAPRPIMWALLFQRDGDYSDPADTDGSFQTMNPAGYHPTNAPFTEPWNASPVNVLGWSSVDFTKLQHVELQISWDVADPDVRIAPWTGLAIAQGGGSNTHA